MAKLYVVISYDLKTPPGKHEEFIKKMKDLNWNFSYKGNKLPNTTCWCSFPEDSTMTETSAKDLAIKEMKNVEKDIQKTTSTFLIERYYIIAFKAPDAVIAFDHF